MAQPRQYTQTTTFNDWTTTNPSDPHIGSKFDTEFTELKQNTDDLNTNIALIQRDDGKIKNESIHKDAFDQDALALIGASGSGFNVKGDWAASTAYVAGDLVNNNDATYLTAVTSFTSASTFTADASNWTLIANSAISTSGASVNMASGDGSNKVFTTQYKYTEVTDIQVFISGVLVATNLYTITNSGGANNITFTTAPASGTNNVIIWGDSVVSQQAKADTLGYRDTANNHKTTASRWAYHTGSVVTDAETSSASSEYSAKEYATGTAVPTGSAADWAQLATTPSATATDASAREWAIGTSAHKNDGSAKSWAQDADQVDGAGANDRSAKAWAQGASMTGSTLGGSSKDWAQTLTTQIDGSEYSAKEYAIGTAATSAKSYATKTDGVVTGTDYSAKSWAMSTDSNAPTDGSAKEWAKTTGAVVADSEYSAKEYAIGTTVAAGSAKDWALQAEDSVVDGGSGYSSLHYAAKSSASATASAASATASASSATASANSAASISQQYDGFNDKYLGTMSDSGATSSASTTGTWTSGSSTVTVASNTGISVGQLFASAGGAGVPTGANVLSIDGTSVVISDTFTAAQSGATAVTFNGYGVYGNFNATKDGPDKDNDNNTLVAGTLYFNTTDNTMKIYDGGNWIAATSAGTASLLEYKFVTTSAQVSSKTYSGTADIGGSMSYTASNTLVYLNGVLLKETVPSGATHDYVAQNGTSVVLTNAPALNDELTVVAYKSFTVADTVSASSGGTFSSAVTFGAGLTSTTTITANGGIETSTTGKIKQKGQFMDNSFHQSWVLGG